MKHLGPRVADLVDGRLSPAEEERAWAHVHGCSLCRAAVEREGWVKSQLSCLARADAGPAPHWLKGSLATGPPRYPEHPVDNPVDSHRRGQTLVALGAGSVGAAMFGVLVFAAAPAQAPVMERRAPVTSLVNGATQGTTQGANQGLVGNTSNGGASNGRAPITTPTAVATPGTRRTQEPDLLPSVEQLWMRTNQ